MSYKNHSCAWATATSRFFFFILQSDVYGSCQFCGTNGTVAKDEVNFVWTIGPGSCSYIEYNVTCIIFHYILPSTNEIVQFSLIQISWNYIFRVCCVKTGEMLTFIFLKQSCMQMTFQIRLVSNSYFKIIFQNNSYSIVIYYDIINMQVLETHFDVS